jgi:hypothetical protein
MQSPCEVPPVQNIQKPKFCGFSSVKNVTPCGMLTGEGALEATKLPKLTNHILCAKTSAGIGTRILAAHLYMRPSSEHHLQQHVHVPAHAWGKFLNDAAQMLGKAGLKRFVCHR